MRFALRLAGLLGALALAGMQAVGASAGVSQQEIPAPDIVNPCNGELVLTTGTIHLSFVSTARNLHTRANFQGVKGVGSVTGFAYTVSGASQFHGTFNSRGQAEFTTIEIIHVVAPGTGQHFISRFVFHEAGTPSGHISVTLHTSQTCAGSPRIVRLGSLAIDLSSATPGNRGRLAASNRVNGPSPEPSVIQAPAAAASATAGPVSTIGAGPKNGAAKTLLPRATPAHQASGQLHRAASPGIAGELPQAASRGHASSPGARAK